MSAEASGGTLRRAGTLLAGSGGSQLIALALAPLLTRLYDPRAFGAFGIFVAITTLAASIATLGLENAVVIESDQEQARVGFGVSLVFACLASVAAAAAAWAARCAGLLAELPQAGVWLVGPSVLALSAGTVFANRALGLGRPAAVAAGRLLRGAGIGVAQTALAAGSASGFSLIVGGVAGQVLAVAATAWMLRAAPGPRLGSAAARAALLRDHRSLVRWSALQTLVNNLGNSAVPAILGRIAGDAAVGAFTLANRVVLLPAVTIGEAFRQSLLTSMSRIADDDAALRRLAIRTSVALAVPLGLAAALLVATGPALFALLFGPRWRDAGLDAGLLLAAQAAGIANIPAVTVITVRGWQRGLLAFGAATLPIRLTALAAATEAGVASGLAVWCALSAAASLAVTLATLARLHAGPSPILQEVPG